MATVTGFTAARMLAIENNSVVDGTVVGDNLILTRQDTTTIDAGSVRGPTGSPGITQGQLESETTAAFLIHAPIGSVIEYIEAVAPNALWLAMVGQTVTNGQTLYPIFWDKIPAAMKSGANILMPDTRGKVVVGLNTADVDFDTIGKTGGEKAHTLSTTEMPVHTHTGPSHQHTYSGVTGTVSADHSHAWSGTTSSVSVDHRHQGVSGRALLQADSWQATSFVEGAGGSNMKAVGSVIGSLTNFMSENGSATHSHSVSGQTGGISTNHNHAFSGTTSASGTANTGSTGSGVAHNNVQPYITLLKIIKVA